MVRLCLQPMRTFVAIRRALRASVFRLALVALLMMGGAAAMHGAAAGATDPKTQLEARQRAFFDAVSERDAARAAEHFAASGVLQVAGMPILEGREAIQRFYGNLFSFLSASSGEPEHTRVSASGDLAYSTGRTTNRFDGPQGAREYEGKYLLVWQRTGDDWEIAAYAISSDRQEPGR